METTNEIVVPEHYNPNQLVTYKVIEDGNATYPTSKVTDVEYALDQGRYWRKQWNDLSGKVARLENDLEQYLEMDGEDIVSAICEIFGFDATKEVEFEATARITGTVSIPLSELKDFDIDNIDLYVNVDSYAYNVNADAEIEDVSRVDQDLFHPFFQVLTQVLGMTLNCPRKILGGRDLYHIYD